MSVLIVAGWAAVLSFAGSSKEKSTAEVRSLSTSVDKAAEALSLLELEGAALAFRVAFDHSLDTWQGTVDQPIPGCQIGGELAEKGLQELRPWIDRRAGEEATKLLSNPKNYKLPVSEESCSADCTCGIGLRILEAAKLDQQTHSKFKDWKRIRARLEGQAELQTSERSELCAEGITWICKSDLLNAIKSGP